MLTEINKAIARQLTEALDEGDIDRLHELLSPDFVSHFSGMPKPLDREQFIQFNKMVKEAFPDFEFTIQDLIAEGDRVAVRLKARGTHMGEFQGIAATGKQFEISGITIYRMADGKVVEQWVNNDQLGMMQQLGVVHAPGQMRS